MPEPHSDALVLFGATDLAYEQIFPALQALTRRGHLDVPVITMAEAFGVRGRGRFYEEVGAVRDVFQNHLLQILSLLAMDRPAASDGHAIDAAKVALLRAIRLLRSVDVVRGQYQGYRTEEGVAADSRVETYVAARLAIENRRWAGVPFGIRTGKCLTATCVHFIDRSSQGARGSDNRRRRAPRRTLQSGRRDGTIRAPARRRDARGPNALWERRRRRGLMARGGPGPEPRRAATRIRAWKLGTWQRRADRGARRRLDRAGIVTGGLNPDCIEDISPTCRT